MLFSDQKVLGKLCFLSETLRELNKKWEYEECRGHQVQEGTQNQAVSTASTPFIQPLLQLWICPVWALILKYKGFLILKYKSREPSHQPQHPQAIIRYHPPGPAGLGQWRPLVQVSA